MRGSKYTFTFSSIMAVIAIVLISAIGSCAKLPNNGVAFYLQLDSSKVVVANPNYYGSASSSIPGVWATTGSHNLGAYELPIDIPVLAGGNVPFAISAGIYDNGIVNAPVMYPFYVPDTFTIYNVTPGHVYHHKPVYTYYANTAFAVNENFDGDNQFTNVTPLTNPTDSSVYEGLRSGGIVLPSNVDSVIALQTNAVTINTDGRQAYLEMNYKINNPNVLCDVTLIATLIVNGSITEQNITDKLILTGPIGYWNKIYVNFNNEIGANPNYAFQVQLTGYHSQGQKDTVYLDNIKLLYFHD